MTDKEEIDIKSSEIYIKNYSETIQFKNSSLNLLSLIMWVMIAVKGAKVYSTVLMWFVYLLLAAYFYILWKKELTKEV